MFKVSIGEGRQLSYMPPWLPSLVTGVQTPYHIPVTVHLRPVWSLFQAPEEPNRLQWPGILVTCTAVNCTLLPLMH